MPGPSVLTPRATRSRATDPPRTGIAAREVEPPPATSELDAEQTMAVLSSVLDDLGAAHHRPFSRE